jgi:alkylhydroperoxidase family enzyme
VGTRYDDLIAALRDASRRDEPPPAAMQGYLELVRQHADRITDDDVERLLAAGLTEDVVFEHTVAVAVASGLERLDAGMRALR